MKNRNEIFAVVLALACCTALSAPAAPQGAPAATAAPQAPVCKGEIAKPAEYMKLVKVTDGLYAMRCTGNEPKSLLPYPPPQTVAGRRTGGCATAVNGNLMGRNMDFIINNCPYIVLWTDHGDDHYASISMASYPIDGSNNPLEDVQYVDYSKLDDPAQVAKIPEMALDGVNERGVAVSTLMVEALDANNTQKGTNPGKPEIGFCFVCRYVLDHAGSAREAVELLQNANIVNKPVNAVLHWIISDGKDTFVVEVSENRVHVSDRHRVITNYLLTKPQLTPHPYGIERADYLRKHLGEADTPDKMQALMRDVRYSQTYSRDTEPFWWSEHYGVDSESDFTINTPHDDPAFQASITELVEAAKVVTTSSNPLVVWDTSYSTVYDIAKKALRITLHEHFGEYFKAKL